MKKYIKIEEGSYRGQDMSGRIFPILKDYQKFTGGKDGGFVTVDCSEFDGFEGLDKARINVAEIGKLTIVPVGQYIIHRDELKKDNKPNKKELKELEKVLVNLLELFLNLQHSNHLRKQY